MCLRHCQLHELEIVARYRMKIAYRSWMTCCFNRVHSSSSLGFKPLGGCTQNRLVSSSNNSSTVMNDLNVIKKFLMNVGSGASKHPSALLHHSKMMTRPHASKLVRGELLDKCSWCSGSHTAVGVDEDLGLVVVRA